MAKLFEELKRRKVFRVAAVYAVVAWLLLQVADVLAPMLSLPDTAPRLILFILIVMFPISLFLAWAYELTPDSIRADHGEINSTGRGDSPLSTFAFIGIVLAVGVAIYVGNRADVSSLETDVADAPDSTVLDKSIAVLPFNAFSSDPDEQFFADGLSDTLLHNLAQLNDIRVISRTSSFQFRGEAIDVREVGAELNVATILEGSVQRSGDRLRIIAQLVNTADGGHIWSQTFDRGADDIFAIHDEISAAVVESLQVTMSPREAQALADIGTDSVEAYNLLTLVRERSGAIPAFEVSGEVLQAQQEIWLAEVDRILELDPDYAEAYRVKAGIYDGLAFVQGGDQGEENLQQAFDAIHQAMLLEPENPVNLSMYANLLRRDGDGPSAEVFARMALARIPDDLRAQRALAFALNLQGKNLEEQLDIALREVAYAEANGEVGYFPYRRLIFQYSDMERFDEALAVIDNQLDSTDQPQLQAADLVLILSNRQGRYVETAERLIRIRNRMENNFEGNVFRRGWFELSSNVGLSERARGAIDGMSGGEALFRNILELVRQGRYQEALEQALGFEFGNLAQMRSVICTGLRDFECVLEQILIDEPQLESRGVRTPNIITIGDFIDSVNLLQAYRSLGEIEAANKLAGILFDRVENMELARMRSSYHTARLYAGVGDTTRALEILRENIMLPGDRFIPSGELPLTDYPEFEALAGNNEFEQLMAEYERRKAVNGERVAVLFEEAGY